MTEATGYDLSQNPTIDSQGNLEFVPREKTATPETTKEKVNRLVKGLQGIKKEAGDFYTKNPRKFDSYANAVAKEVVGCVKANGLRILDPALFPSKASPEVLYVEQRVIEQFLKSDDPLDFQYLARFLAAVPPKTLMTDEALYNALQKFIKKFEAFLQSDLLDETTFQECMQLICKMEPDIQYLTRLLTTVKLTDKAFDLVIEDCSKARACNENLSNLCKAIDQSDEMLAKLKKLPGNLRNEVYRLAIFSSAPVFDAESLKIMAQSLRATEQYLGEENLWKKVAFLTNTDSFNFTEREIKDLISWLANDPKVDAATYIELLKKFSQGVQEYLQSQTLASSFEELNSLIQFAHSLEKAPFKDKIASQLADIFVNLVKKNMDAFVKIENPFKTLKALFNLELSDDHIGIVRKAYELAKGDLSKEPFVTLNRVFQRYDQLKNMMKKKSHIDVLRTAYFFESELPKKISGIAKTTIISRKESKLSSSIIIYPEAQTKETDQRLLKIAVADQRLTESGSTKKLIEDVLVSLGNFIDISIGVRAYSRKHLGGQGVIEMSIDNKFLVKLQKIPQVVQVNYYLEHSFTDLSKKEPTQASLGMERLEDASAVGQPGRFISQEIAVIFKDFIDGLSAVHGEGVLHRDIKPENFLLKKVGGETHGRIGDFGRAKDFTPPIKVPTQPGLYFKNHYSTIRYTAPELLWNENFDGDPFQIESFALGVSLYQMLENEDPPHVKIIEAQKDKAKMGIQNGTLDADKRKEMRKEVRDEIEKMFKSDKYKELLTKEKAQTLTQKEKLLLLAYSMMRLVDDKEYTAAADEKRCSIHESTAQIDKIVREG